MNVKRLMVALTLAVMVTVSVAGPRAQVEATQVTYWQAGHESGTFSEWNLQGLGGVFNSGNSTSTIAYGPGKPLGFPQTGHSGLYYLQNYTPSDPNNIGGNGARVFRTHLEAQNQPPYPSGGLREGWFSAWYWWKQDYEVPNWWNVWEWKSYYGTGSGQSAPTWVIAVGNRGNGHMYLYMRDRVHEQNYTQTALDITSGQWTHIEAYFKASPASESTGDVVVYQDGTLILQAHNVQTTFTGSQYGDYNYGWAVTNYPDLTNPNASYIFVDDAAITSERVGP